MRDRLGNLKYLPKEERNSLGQIREDKSADLKAKPYQ